MMLQRLLRLNAQYRRPSGFIGRWVGEKMADQHRSENLWTVDLLDVQPTDQLLEVGFGPGFALQQVASMLTTGVIAGVDFSATMVSAAKRRNAQAVKAGRVDVRYGEVKHLPFADNGFDKVFSINSLYFWIEPLEAFSELRRVIKPNGMLLLTFLPTERWEGAPEGTADFKPYSSVEVQTLLAQAGFRNMRVEADPTMQHRANFSVIAQK
jgi:ubiquinone/menaquinone biosynthesis C-methylase UbiE